MPRAQGKKRSTGKGLGSGTNAFLAKPTTEPLSSLETVEAEPKKLAATNLYTDGLAKEKKLIEKPEFLLDPEDKSNPLNLWAMLLNPEEQKYFVMDVPLEKIKAREGNESQVRYIFDKVELSELAESIRLNGVQSPSELTYDAENDTYWIETGERRTRGAKLAGLETYNAFVYLVRPEKPILRQLMENIQRSDLTAFEVMDAILRVKDEMAADGLDTSMEAIAKQINKKKPFVAKHLNLSNIDSSLRKYIDQHDLVSDFQFMDYLRKLWAQSKEVVEHLFLNKDRYSFNRPLATSLLKGLKSEYSETISEGFMNFGLLNSDQIEAALRYLEHPKAEKGFISAQGSGLAVEKPNYIEYQMFTLDQEIPVEVSETTGSEVVSTNTHSPVNETVTAESDDASSIEGEKEEVHESIEVDISNRILSGKLKDVGECFLNLKLKDENRAYAWFIVAADKSDVRGKLSDFSLKEAY